MEEGHAAEAAAAETDEQPPATHSYRQQPMQLVDLVRPGPTGTVASTAAVATAAHAAVVAAAPDIAPAGLLATVAASKASRRKSISTVMQVSWCMQHTHQHTTRTPGFNPAPTSH